ncbi:hypothetical protein [Bacillus pseudomycoides]|uniref:hypothetical protein n=1 Tax=Bacillus pseudomycoides TaxID=64104 RepID=UPI000BF7DBBC|nr:hypothetical protein [Bacillus pseudomycoides]MED1535441.1 hypothetical protein [Bacillus pseudomycoides]PGD75907.1 hypothetical protein COM46_13220 [Bacillus pseudomycoides]
MNENFFFVSYMWENTEEGVSWTPGHTVINEHPSEWYERVKWQGNENYKIVSFQSISKEEYEKFEVIL